MLDYFNVKSCALIGSGHRQQGFVNMQTMQVPSGKE